MSMAGFPILLVGCGRMGGALARQWLPRHPLLVHDPYADLPVGARRIDQIDAEALPEDLVVVLAVKPQFFGQVAPALSVLAARGALFVSIMAGVTLDGLGDALGEGTRIVRAMPNTPAAIGCGITAAIAGDPVTDEDRDRIDALLRPTGELVWLSREADLDAVTAVSGSGPAYFFRMTEALALAGEAAGLAPDLAVRLARATFSGAAALADRRAKSLAMLRAEVTSPGGTTAAGLACFDMDDRLDRLMTDVVTAAAIRARELSG